jgi:hypothetical protein
MDNFMISDTVGTLLGALLVIPILVIPGLAISHLTNALEFKSMSSGLRNAVGLVLGMATMPGLLFLVSRLLPFFYVWVMLAAFNCFWLATVVKYNSSEWFDRNSWLFISLMALLGTATVIPIQIGEELFPFLRIKAPAYYILIISSFVEGIVPPNNYGYNLIEASGPIKYHYFWFLTCSIIDQLGGGVVKPHTAYLAGTIWIRIALCCVVILCLKRFFPTYSTYLAILGVVLLLCVEGLGLLDVPFRDQLPVVSEFGEGNYGGLFQTWEFDIVVQSHHVAALVALLTSFLLWSQSVKLAFRERASLGMISAVGIMSTVGLSIQMGIMAAATTILWLTVSTVKRWWDELFTVIPAAVVSLVLALPYLMDLLTNNIGPGNTNFIDMSLWEWAVAREFLSAHDIGNWWASLAIMTLSYPVLFVTDMGVLLVAAFLFWRHQFKQITISRDIRFLFNYLCAAILVFLFIKFPGGPDTQNELVFKSFLTIKFLMYLCATPVIFLLLSSWFPKLRTIGNRIALPSIKPIRFALGFLLVVGFATATYNRIWDRVDSYLGNRWSPSAHTAEKTFAYREAFEWVGARTPIDAVFQHDVFPMGSAVSGGWYGTRRFGMIHRGVAPATDDGRSAQVRLAEYLKSAFHGDSTMDSVITEGSLLGIDFLVVTSDDSIWAKQNSWVYKGSPIFQNQHSKIFPLF